MQSGIQIKGIYSRLVILVVTVGLVLVPSLPHAKVVSLGLVHAGKKGIHFCFLASARSILGPVIELGFTEIVLRSTPGQAMTENRAVRQACCNANALPSVFPGRSESLSNSAIRFVFRTTSAGRPSIFVLRVEPPPWMK